MTEEEFQAKYLNKEMESKMPNVDQEENFDFEPINVNEHPLFNQERPLLK